MSSSSLRLLRYQYLAERKTQNRRQPPRNVLVAPVRRRIIVLMGKSATLLAIRLMHPDPAKRCAYQIQHYAPTIPHKVIGRCIRRKNGFIRLWETEGNELELAVALLQVHDSEQCAVDLVLAYWQHHRIEPFHEILDR